MRSKYHPAEIRAAMTLKSLTTIAISKQMSISRRTLDYFISGQLNMSRSEEFIGILQPELDEISKTFRKHIGKNLQHCEVG